MMLYIGVIILLFTLIQLLVAVANTLFLPKLVSRQPSESPLVSILIPARNEENNIVNILNDILDQDYTNIEVAIFNDQSDDRTAEVVKQYSERDTRITLIDSDGLPNGWYGKNYACYSLAKNAHGKYLLFLDADVRIGKGLIVNSLSFMEQHDTVLLTIFPKQIMVSAGEKLTVPNMIYILLSLLPLILVRKSAYPAFAAANGQFMMFDSAAYRLFEPHEKMKNDMVEDISTARYLKNKKQKIACMTGDDTIRCRMYAGFSDAVNGFSKNVAAFFGNSLILAILFWVVTTFGFIVVISAFSPLVIILYFSAYLLTRVLVSSVSEQNILQNILLLIPQQFSCGLFVLKAVINEINKKHQWKGRYIH
ncbi:MAG: glycosyltransferase family 2 protein [Bacteroidales bacterium]